MYSQTEIKQGHTEVLMIDIMICRPHQIQCPGGPEHPAKPPGLPKITQWEPEGLLENLEEFFEN